MFMTVKICDIRSRGWIRWIRGWNVCWGQLTQQMAALMENQNRRNPNPNSDPDREEIEYDSNSEGNATLFFEEDSSDDAFFVMGGDREPDFDKDDEGDDNGSDEN
ncbi:hypothetical protein CDL15_Pgr013473 [Punica granatum]|uniref:Uncharacterized protein n=1 Tax=Punica granatum TaxID=22663 RepID=A0A218W0S5_PUNGR|nr:hypothetical protein CDL15_Pgr013473 [Punica granatum]